MRRKRELPLVMYTFSYEMYYATTLLYYENEILIPNANVMTFRKGNNILVFGGYVRISCFVHT